MSFRFVISQRTADRVLVAVRRIWRGGVGILLRLIMREDHPLWPIIGEETITKFDDENRGTRQEILFQRETLASLSWRIDGWINCAFLLLWIGAGMLFRASWIVRILLIPIWLIAVSNASGAGHIAFLSPVIFGSKLLESIRTTAVCARDSSSLAFSAGVAKSYAWEMPLALVIGAGALIFVHNGNFREFVCIAVLAHIIVSTNSLHIALPPYILLLAVSSRSSAKLMIELNEAFLGCRSVALFAPAEEDKLGSIRGMARQNSFRTNDDTSWQSIVWKLCSMAKIVVIDCRKDSVNIRIEREFAKKVEFARKTLVLLGPHPSSAMKKFVRKHNLATVPTERALLLTVKRLRSRRVLFGGDAAFRRVFEKLRW
jgi:hypothetical protein